jgi:hypothetical protein
MRGFRLLRHTSLLAIGAVLLQAGGCTFQVLNDVLQTMLLGLSAAGAYEIIRNL